MYYNARYYDSALGLFLSPDTLIPDPGAVIDYNRFAYVRNNPLRFSDPSGHYTDDEIVQHYGCADWACVEAHYQNGGSHAGMWGWLEVLMKAQNGDDVEAFAASIYSGYIQSSGQFAIEGGQIVIHNGTITIYGDGKAGGTFSLGSSVSEAGFSSLAFMRPGGNASDESFYQLPARGLLMQNYNQMHPDCRHTDCPGRALNAVSTGAATTAAVCSVFAPPCTGAATFVGALSGGISTLRAGIKAAKNSWATADVVDLVVTGLTTIAGTGVRPLVSPVISAGQWGYDEYISPRIH